MCLLEGIRRVFPLKETHVYLCSLPVSSSLRIAWELQARLVAALEEPPSDGGLWTGRKVAHWILAHTGRKVHPQRGWEYLKRLNFSKRVLRPRHAKADPAAQEAFKKTFPSK